MDSPDIPKGTTKTHSIASNDEAATDGAGAGAGADSGARPNRRLLILSTAVLALLLLAAVAVGLGVGLGKSDSSDKNRVSEAQQQQQAVDQQQQNGDNTSTQTDDTASTSRPSSAPTTMNPSATPSGRPSLQPSGAPSAGPSLRPSVEPSLRPSVEPSGRPSSRPSGAPSGIPSSNPTTSPTSAPTRPLIPDGFTFRIKMHWERKYFWQEEDVERQYCFECTTCSALTSSGFGEGCYDYRSSDGTDCRNLDQLWIQFCNGWSGGRGNAEFEIVRGEVSDQVKIRNKNLCLTRASKLYLNLQVCDKDEVRQQWLGFEMDKPFELRPLEQNWRPQNYGGPVEKERCLSQHHHPKPYEVMFLEECRLGLLWDTILYETI